MRGTFPEQQPVLDPILDSILGKESQQPFCRCFVGVDTITYQHVKETDTSRTCLPDPACKSLRYILHNAEHGGGYSCGILPAKRLQLCRPIHSGCRVANSDVDRIVLYFAVPATTKYRICSAIAKGLNLDFVIASESH